MTRGSIFATAAENKSSQILNLVGFILLCYFTGQLIGLLLTEWFYGVTAKQIATILTLPDKAMAFRNIIIFLQTSSALLSFTLLPAAYLYLIQKQKPTAYFSPGQRLLPAAVLLTALLVLACMPVNALFMEWNKHLQLPEGLAWLEKQLQLREQKGAHLTTLLTTFTSPWQLLAGLFVIAIIPAFGEEFFFRGIIQTNLVALFKNKHVAIVCTGALFSFFHFQFYGFLPRMLQGVLFGYLFYWSKDLCYPMIAHLVNNGFTVVMHYCWQHGLINVNITDTAAVPLAWSLVCLPLTGVLIYTLRRYFSRHLMPDPNFN
jgi:hypothetical protein